MELEENLKDKILAAVSNTRYRPLTAAQLATSMDVTGEALEEFTEALDELENDGYIVFLRSSGRIEEASRAGFIRGVFSRTQRGFGFLVNDLGDDIFLPPGESLGAMHGDTLLVRTDPPRAGRRDDRGPSGHAVRIIHRAAQEFIGTLSTREQFRARKKKPVYFVTPDNARLMDGAVIPAKYTGGAAEGDKVIVRITSYPEEDEPAFGEITGVLGKAESLGANYLAVLHTYEIKTDYPEEAEAFAEKVSQEEITPDGRTDFRGKVIFTIDSESAKDLDDAISIERSGDDYLLGVHIADVSHYVTERSPLDFAAYDRGTSVYFVDKVVPMLPVSLSNGACSLNPGEDRYAMSVIIRIGPDGVMKGSHMYESIIRSRIKGVYEKINDVREKGRESAFYGEYEPYLTELSDMFALADILHKKRVAEGSLELESTEACIELDEKGKPVDIYPRTRGKAEEMIEEFMLSANRAVAALFNEKKKPCVFRIHEKPDEEKMHGFIKMASTLGFDVHDMKPDAVEPLQLADLIRKSNDTPYHMIINSLALRSLAKARYSEHCVGHYGLACKDYCHFTSPIRRYPDLVVHRLLRKLLRGELVGSAEKRAAEFCHKAAEQSSECEARAMQAERSIDDLYKAVYMADHIGEEYEGTVSSVMNFGCFVELANTCEGLVRVTDMQGYYEYDEDRLTLRNKGSGHTIQVGDTVRVRITAADTIQGQLSMVFAEK